MGLSVDYWFEGGDGFDRAVLDEAGSHVVCAGWAGYH